MRIRSKLPFTIALLGACATTLAACGTESISVPKSSAYYHGAVLFQQHCAGCHTLSVAGTEGSATNVKDRLRNQGPDFDVRQENVETVLYAIRNGGFSGQIMPQNVVTGKEAQEVAQFVAHYAGRQAPKVPSVEISLPNPSTETATTGSEAANAASSGGTAAPAAKGTTVRAHK